MINPLYSFSKYSLADYMGLFKVEGLDSYQWEIAEDQTGGLCGSFDQAQIEKWHVVTFVCKNSSDYDHFMIGESDGELTCYCC